MNPQDQARQAVIQALGTLTLQGIEQQIQIAALHAEIEALKAVKEASE